MKVSLWRVSFAVGLVLILVGTLSFAFAAEKEKLPPLQALIAPRIDLRGLEKPVVIGISFGNMFLGQQAEFLGMKAAAQIFGGEDKIKFEIAVADNDAQKQNEQISMLISKGIDVLLIFAVDNVAILKGIAEATKAGIPVIVWDRYVESKDLYFASVLNSFADGYLGGQYMKSLIPNDGKERVILNLVGALNDINAVERRDGFEAGIAGAPNIKIVRMPTDWNAEKALQSTKDALKKYPDLWGIYLASDFMTDAVLTALREAGKLHKVGEPGHVVLVLQDGSYPGYKAVLEGWADAVVSLPLFAEGAMALQAALIAAKANYWTFPGILFTHENIAQHADEIWGTYFAEE